MCHLMTVISFFKSAATKFQSFVFRLLNFIFSFFFYFVGIGLPSVVAKIVGKKFLIKKYPVSAWQKSSPKIHLEKQY